MAWHGTYYTQMMMEYQYQYLHGMAWHVLHSNNDDGVPVPVPVPAWHGTHYTQMMMEYQYQYQYLHGMTCIILK